MTRYVSLLTRCAGILALAALATATSAQEQISQDTQNRLLQTHSDYFTYRETAAFEAAYALLSEAQQQQISLADFSASWRAFHDRYGRLTALETRQVTWSRNPAGLPRGLYATIDYRGVFNDLPFFCGSLIWLVGDAASRIVREDVKIYQPPADSDLTPAARAAIFRELSCN
ncbi:MAG: DUF4019 domain-containing protein [Pseudomonadota bacterium]